MIMLEHPAITNAMRTGYPDGKDPLKYICPKCGADLCATDILVLDNDNCEIIGCLECYSLRTAEDMLEG